MLARDESSEPFSSFVLIIASDREAAAAINHSIASEVGSSMPWHLFPPWQ